MPACAGCIQPCNCTLAEDGFYANRSDLGRNFTNISGSGTSVDPYVISFLDQEEFRPKTAEITIANQSVPSGFPGWNSMADPNVGDTTVIYESPVSFLVKDPIEGHTSYVQTNYFYIGASATLAQTADTSATHKMMKLTAARGDTFPFEEYLIGGQYVPGGGGDPITLTVSAFVPGVFASIEGLGTIIQQFKVYLFQDSGAPVAISDLRIWITQI